MSVYKIKGWISLLLPLQEVPGSDLGPEIGYSKFSMDFFSPSRRMSG
jgi:hypothetical protein